MRTLKSFSLKGMRRFGWLALPLCLLVFVQAFSGPIPDVFKSTTTETAAATPLAVSVNAGSNSPLCAGTTLFLSALITSGTAPYTFSWDGPDGFSSTSQNPSRPGITQAQAGSYSVTVTDGTGMTGSASVTVVVHEPATANAGSDKILCKNATYQLNGAIGGSAASSTWTASVGGGNFTPNPFVLNPTYHPPLNFVGNITLTLTTNNPAGPCNAASDQLLLTYGDPDAMVCNDLVEISLDDDCSVTVTPDMALEGDVLDSLFTVSIFTLQGVNIGNTITSQYIGIPLKIRVTNICSGNFCMTDAIAYDVLPPVFLTCADITVACVVNDYSPQYLQDSLGIAEAYPTVTDNCSPVTLSKNDTWVDVPCGGTFNGNNNLSGYVKRVWTATDASANKSTCTQYIYFERVSIYNLQLPGDVTVACNMSMTDPNVTGAPYYVFNGKIFYLSGTNSFCEINATPTDQLAPFCDGTYSIIRTWTIFNLCGTSSTNPPNPLTHIQVINVVDNKGPDFTCPANLTVSTDPLACCATVDLPDVVMEDACGRVQDASALILVIDPFTGDTADQLIIDAILTTFPGNPPNNSDTLAVFGLTPCLPIGEHIVYYFSEDACGASSSCSFKIKVEDQVPPVAACDEITQVSLGIDGMVFVNASTFDDGSYDNCGPVNFKVRRLEFSACQADTLFYDQVKFCCEDVGDTVMVILRVYDVPMPLGPVALDFEEAHSNDCQVQVYIDDKLKPVCISPGNVTVSCENFDPSLWAYGTPTAADNCCIDTLTVSDNYSAFDTICSKGTIVRTFRVFDCHGLSNQCTQRIIVEYEQDYYIHFPDDVIVTTCNGSGTYGEPIFYGEDCELLGASYEDQVFTVVPDACFKIERTWTIINWCTYDPNQGCTFVPNPNPNATANHPSNLIGPIVSAFGTPAPWAPTVTKISPTEAAVNFSQYWTANANCYKYKQIIKIVDSDKPTIDCPASPVEICDLTDNNAQLWNETYWYDSKLQQHDLCEAPSELCISGSDACSGSNVNIRYLLFLDLDNNGTMETVINSQNLPAANTVFYNNVNSPNYSGGTARSFDERPVPLDQKYRFAIQTNVTGNQKTACVRWNTTQSPDNYVLPQLPYGKHKIKWLVQDGCGNEQTCEYFFEVKDCKAPTVVCLNGLSTSIMQSGMVTLDLQYFLQDAYDNCTPDPMLVYGIRKSGTGTGFPLNPDGTPQTTITFDCTQLSFQLVEVWAMDMHGNAGFCETYVHVQDNIGVCSSTNATVAGWLETDSGNGLEEAHVEVICTAPTGQPPVDLFDMTDEDGHYQFNNAIPIQCNYTVTPIKDNDPLNGVSTFDLVLINKHILGIQKLDSPLKMIAADANNSRSISTFDLVEIRKLILGIYTELPNNTSWRFVDKSYVFPDPADPFKEAFPETKSVWNILGHQMDDDFVAIKIGDVNNNAVPNSLMAVEDRSAGTLLFDVDDRYVKPGEYFTVDFTAAEQTTAYQFTLNYPDLEVEAIYGGPGIADENFAVFTDEYALTTSVGLSEQAAPATFQVRFRAKKAGQLSKMLSVSSLITKAEAYQSQDDQAATTLDVALRFNNGGLQTISGVGFELYQNSPNPWVNKTQIGFHLPQDGDATLTVYDDLGRALFTESANYTKGYNTIFIEHALIDAPGVLYYTLETAFGKATRKMVQSQ
ncbi:MAG: hypothetical protein H6569_11115 [Lewinellaceae bacterium]|nr:hypothetical protein [Lewinellaceae bacterium]